MNSPKKPRILLQYPPPPKAIPRLPVLVNTADVGENHSAVIETEHTQAESQLLCIQIGPHRGAQRETGVSRASTTTSAGVDFSYRFGAAA